MVLDYDIPWDEFTPRVKKANGNRKISTIFSSPDIEREKSRTLDEILSDWTPSKSERRPYQEKIEYV
jgi:hypothetical protein